MKESDQNKKMKQLKLPKIIGIRESLSEAIEREESKEQISKD